MILLKVFFIINVERRTETKDSHIMISYNWGSKPKMLKVRDRLKAAGFNVWMDVDNMSTFHL